jgi:hypothetical protein
MGSFNLRLGRPHLVQVTDDSSASRPIAPLPVRLPLRGRTHQRWRTGRIRPLRFSCEMVYGGYVKGGRRSTPKPDHTGCRCEQYGLRKEKENKESALHSVTTTTHPLQCCHPRRIRRQCEYVLFQTLYSESECISRRKRSSCVFIEFLRDLDDSNPAIRSRICQIPFYFVYKMS